MDVDNLIYVSFCNTEALYFYFTFKEAIFCLQGGLCQWVGHFLHQKHPICPGSSLLPNHRLYLVLLHCIEVPSILSTLSSLQLLLSDFYTLYVLSCACVGDSLSSHDFPWCCNSSLLGPVAGPSTSTFPRHHRHHRHLEPISFTPAPSTTPGNHWVSETELFSHNRTIWEYRTI